MNSYSDQKSLLRKNTISSFVFQATTIICGLIVPRLILKNYGSDVNGLVNSIKQFLSIISFLELGVGAVVQSSLYKPIAEKDEKKINKVLTSANHFFNSIGKITDPVKTDKSPSEFLDCSSYSILIVDDNKLNIKVASRLLEAYKFKIDTASGGKECIYKVKEGKHYDMIFLDHMMPEIDGIKTLHIL